MVPMTGPISPPVSHIGAPIQLGMSGGTRCDTWWLRSVIKALFSQVQGLLEQKVTTF